MKQLRKRLTFSNVVSILALFVALSGATAFAASQLGKNTVGTKQLKKNAVTAAKIKKNAITTAKIKADAVTGAKVKESTLGTVPSATLANSIPPAEPTHVVGAPGEPAFEAGSSSVGAVEGLKFNPVGFYKDHEGIVHLQGWAFVGKNGASQTPVFTLPPGYRPAAGTIEIFEQVQGAPVLVGGTGASFGPVDASGKVIGEEEEIAVLDGITFRAEG
ncbi:MAG TPA: hypothetical protein VFX44_00910 [Solirubrobacterales bacterium]|nr:hypothetical protein [Solirubrobacterales bacterium]